MRVLHPAELAAIAQKRTVFVGMTVIAVILLYAVSYLSQDVQNRSGSDLKSILTASPQATAVLLQTWKVAGLPRIAIAFGLIAVYFCFCFANIWAMVSIWARNAFLRWRLARKVGTVFIWSSTVVALLELVRFPLIVISVIGYTLKGVGPWSVFLLTKGEMALMSSGALYVVAAFFANVYTAFRPPEVSLPPITPTTPQVSMSNIFDRMDTTDDTDTGFVPDSWADYEDRDEMRTPIRQRGYTAADSLMSPSRESFLETISPWGSHGKRYRYLHHQDVDHIPGVGPVYREQLSRLGLVHVTDVLEHAATDQQRAYITEETGIPEENLEEIHVAANLMRVRNLGRVNTEIMMDAGVKTPEALAEMDAIQLQQELSEIASQSNHRRPPLRTVRRMITGAKLYVTAQHRAGNM